MKTRTITKKNFTEDQIRGAIYGFAIGDAMGATTEFMTKEEISINLGKVTEMVGGGWLNLKKGYVTDDTEMMLCVLSALAEVKQDGGSLLDMDRVADVISNNFAIWLNTDPKDVGNCCREVIGDALFDAGPDRTICHQELLMYARIKNEKYEALGNGSLMRALPIFLFVDDSIGLNLLQSRLTHFNSTVDAMIRNYEKVMTRDGSLKFYGKYKLEPTGHVINTFSNACYSCNNNHTFEDVITSVVNEGGDADTIGAIAGSIKGIRCGYSSIPQRWLKVLNKHTKTQIEDCLKILLN